MNLYLKTLYHVYIFTAKLMLRKKKNTLLAPSMLIFEFLYSRRQSHQNFILLLSFITVARDVLTGCERKHYH